MMQSKQDRVTCLYLFTTIHIVFRNEEREKGVTSELRGGSLTLNVTLQSTHTWPIQQEFIHVNCSKLLHKAKVAK